MATWTKYLHLLHLIVKGRISHRCSEKIRPHILASEKFWDLAVFSRIEGRVAIPSRFDVSLWNFSTAMNVDTLVKIACRLSWNDTSKIHLVDFGCTMVANVRLSLYFLWFDNDKDNCHNLLTWGTAPYRWPCPWCPTCIWGRCMDPSSTWRKMYGSKLNQEKDVWIQTQPSRSTKLNLENLFILNVVLPPTRDIALLCLCTIWLFV